MKNEEKINLGRIFKFRREELSYSQKDVAELTGLPLSLYQKYEYNICRPKLEYLLALFYCLQLSLDKVSEAYMESNETKFTDIKKLNSKMNKSKYIGIFFSTKNKIK